VCGDEKADVKDALTCFLEANFVLNNGTLSTNDGMLTFVRLW